MDWGGQLGPFEVEQEWKGLVTSAAAFEISTKHGHEKITEHSQGRRCDIHCGARRSVERKSPQAPGAGQ